MKFRIFFFLPAILLLFQCDNLFMNENSTASISAVIEGDELVIRNSIHFDVYFFAVDQETSYLINWAPYESEENRIRANSTRVFSTDEIVGYDPEKMVIIFTWNNEQTYWEDIEIEP